VARALPILWALLATACDGSAHHKGSAQQTDTAQDTGTPTVWDTDTTSLPECEDSGSLQAPGFVPKGFATYWDIGIDDEGKVGLTHGDDISYLWVYLYGEGWGGAGDTENACRLRASMTSAEPWEGEPITGAWTSWRVPLGAVDSDGPCDELDQAEFGSSAEEWFHSMTWGIGVGSIDQASSEFQAAIEPYLSDDGDSLLAGWLYNPYLFGLTELDEEALAINGVYTYGLDEAGDPGAVLADVSDWEGLQACRLQGRTLLGVNVPHWSELWE